LTPIFVVAGVLRDNIFFALVVVPVMMLVAALIGEGFVRGFHSINDRLGGRKKESPKKDAR